MELPNIQQHWLRRYGLARALLTKIVDECEKGYGWSGRWISGGFCEDWPENMKNRIRRLNRAMNRYADNAFKFRPRYQRVARTRALLATAYADAVELMVLYLFNK